MKESKTNHNLKSEKIDEFVDKKFEEDLAEIKQKLNAEKLSDEFKENLISKLENELNKNDSENTNNSNTKNNIINFPAITRKIVGICACFIFLFTSCFAFADEIENVFFRFFSNTDEIIERAIENGNYKQIDMDYVEDNGVSIKVDYIIKEEDCLYIAFNVKNEEEFDKIVFDEIIIKNQENKTLCGKREVENILQFNFEKQFINSKNLMIMYKMTNINEINNSIEELLIDIKKMYFYKNKNTINKNGNWELKVNI